MLYVFFVQMQDDFHINISFSAQFIFKLIKVNKFSNIFFFNSALWKVEVK